MTWWPRWLAWLIAGGLWIAYLTEIPTMHRLQPEPWTTEALAALIVGMSLFAAAEVFLLVFAAFRGASMSLHDCYAWYRDHPWHWLTPIVVSWGLLAWLVWIGP